MSLASRNLFQDKTRLALSVGGVALAVMLILILNGFLAGMNRQITSYLDNSSGSVVVAQKGVVDLLGATSLLPPGIVVQVEAEQGVGQVIPLLSQFVILDLHGKKQPAYLIGYDPDRGGGPWRIHTGREPQTDGEMVLDRILAERHNLTLGDSIELMGQNFTIVGLSDGTTSWMTSFFFIRKSAAEKLLRAPGAVSFLLLTPSEGADTNELVRRLDDLQGVNALTKTTMATNDIKLFAKIFSAPLKLMVAIAFLVGTMIIGLVIYTATVERQREYGVLKAIGAPNRVLYTVVTMQALFASLAGSVVGILLAYGAAEWIMSARPQFLIAFDPWDITWALFAGLGMALAAALFPARVVAGLAPAEVFRK
ncbi:MAG: FtsX-like permease family protein [Anaerolineales bacterium]